ncbi:MAG: cache domain-containing protein, partial [Desulfuromonadaceae bacterium]
MTQITRFNILATALAGLILALSISYFFIFLPYREYSEQVVELRQLYISEEKKTIRLEVERVLNELEFLTQDHLRHVEKNLILNLTDMQSLLEYERFSNLNKVQAKLADMRRDMGHLHQTAYFVLDPSNRVLSASKGVSLRKLGLDAELSNPEIDSVLQPLWESNPKQLTRISWPTADSSSGVDVYALYTELEEEGLRIVALIPKHVSDKHLQRRFLERLSQVRYGADRSGYFYILNSDAQPIMSPVFSPAFNQDLSPKPIGQERLATARRLVQVAQNGGGYVEHVFENPVNQNKKGNKIAYVTTLPRWGWVLGTGFYTSALNQRINAQKEGSLENTHDRARIGVVVVLLNLLLGFVIAYITNRHIRRIEAKREAHLKRLKQYSDLLDEICLVSKGDLEGNITYANDKFCEVSG